MKTITSFRAIVAISYILTLLSCNSNDEFTEYAWIKSDALPPINIVNKSKNINEVLYLAGMVNGEYGIFKFQNNMWVKIVSTVGLTSIQDFTFYNQTMYFGNQEGLYKVVQSNYEKIAEISYPISAMETYNNKLYISGYPIFEEGETYSGTIIFDGVDFNHFSPYSGNSMLLTNDKLYIQNVGVISDQDFKFIPFISGSNITVDDQGNLFNCISYIAPNSNKSSILQKFNNGETSFIGDSIKSSVYGIHYANNILFTYGQAGPDFNNEIQNYYFQNGQWKFVNDPIYGPIIEYGNKLIAVELGQLYEFKRTQLF